MFKMFQYLPRYSPDWPGVAKDSQIIQTGRKTDKTLSDQECYNWWSNLFPFKIEQKMINYEPIWSIKVLVSLDYKVLQVSLII